MNYRLFFFILAAVVSTVASVSGQSTTPNSGITEAFLDVKLSTAVPGIISKKSFKEGDAVRAGDVILELDSQLEKLEVERRKAIVENRRVDRDATTVLFKSSKGMSKEELDKKELEYKVAQAEYDTAVEQLRRRSLVSPLAGVITEMEIEEGEACQPYQPMVRVVDVERCYFITHLEAKDAVRLKLGQTVKVEIQTGAAPAKVEGKIVFLSPVADSASGLVRMKAVFENPKGKIRPGLAGKMSLE
jgi:RND family efflux transporter MFP subunit